MTAAVSADMAAYTSSELAAVLQEPRQHVRGPGHQFIRVDISGMTGSPV